MSITDSPTSTPTTTTTTTSSSSPSLLPTTYINDTTKGSAPNGTPTDPRSKLTYTTISPTPANIDKFTSIISSAFHSTPLTTIITWEIDSAAPSSPSSAPSLPIPHARRHAHFHPGISSAAHSGAILVQAGTDSALALWEPPTFTGTPFINSRAQPGPILSEWRTAVRRTKATYLALPNQQHLIDERRWDEVKLKPFWHLSFLARNPSTSHAGPLHEPHVHATPAVPGAISAVIVPFLQRAREEGVQAWLEATEPHAVAIYEHFGFRVCERVVVGRGMCDGRGWPCVGDEAVGVSAWIMIFDEHLR